MIEKLITWRDLKTLVDSMTEDQLDWSLAVQIATEGDQEGETYGVADDGSKPRLLYVPGGSDENSPLDDDQHFLRLEI